MSEAVARLRAAGHPDSESLVRELADSGVLRSYKTPKGGHRRISVASLNELIDKRSAEAGGASPTGSRNPSAGST
jgi:hypothetical protein